MTDQMLTVCEGAAQSRPRRKYTAEQRRQIVMETYAPGASVSLVARRHDVNTNLLFKWRERYGERGETEAVMLPVQITDTEAAAAAPAPCKTGGRRRALKISTAGWIEIELSGGHRLRIHGAADPRTVQNVLRNLAR